MRNYKYSEKTASIKKSLIYCKQIIESDSILVLWTYNIFYNNF